MIYIEIILSFEFDELLEIYNDQYGTSRYDADIFIDWYTRCFEVKKHKLIKLFTSALIIVYIVNIDARKLDTSSVFYLEPWMKKMFRQFSGK
jgi:hypothetical protein